MATHTTNYNLEKPEATDPFGDFRQSYNANMDIIDANLGGGGGSGGHTILDGDGNALPQEDDLQFTGACSVTDDNVNGRTVVDIKGGYILDATRYSDTEKVVGVWRDNKPLYKKTVHISALPSSAGSQQYPHNIANIDKICHYESISRASSGSSVILNRVGLNGANFNGAVSYDVFVNTTVINITVGQDRSNIEADVTIWYTKTTDTAGSGGYEAYGFTPIIYSDVERKVGVWRDNKPLYAKTLNFSGINVDNNNTTIGTISNLDTFVKGIGTAKEGSYTYAIAEMGMRIRADASGNVTLRAMNNATWSNISGSVCVLYTKTTDVAGSGDYNTYGVPTVHYSTSEQVVGTWFGKPLYEKTIVKNNIAMGNNGGNLTSIPHGVSNLKECVRLEMACPKLNYITTSDITSAGGSVIATFRVDTTNVFCSGGNNYFGGTADRYWYITIRYTKTTD